MVERTPLPTSRGRGRPRKEADANIELPSQRFDPSAPEGGWLPPGSTMPVGKPMLAGSAPGEGNIPFTAELQSVLHTPPAITAQPVPEPKHAPLDEANVIEWAAEELNNALDTFGEQLSTIIQTIGERRPVVSEKLIGAKTCLDCVHSVISSGMCGKFGMVPPMKVIANAKANCPDFSEEEAPFDDAA
jgi:hypothetical protein